MHHRNKVNGGGDQWQAFIVVKITGLPSSCYELVQQERCVDINETVMPDANTYKVKIFFAMYMSKYVSLCGW